MIFYSYVSLPEGKYGDSPYDQEIECSHVLTQRKNQWEFQDPMHGGTLVPFVWPYFVGIFSYIGRT